jgi:hypothetical protein
MTNKTTREFVELLLGQELPVDDHAYAEHREKISKRLMLATRNERIMRFATIAVWIAAFSFLPLMFIAQQLSPGDHRQAPPGLFVDYVFPVIFIVSVGCGGVAIPLTLSYYLRYRRAVDRLENDSRDATLKQLQDTVASLSEQLRQAKSEPPDPGLRSESS